MIKPKQHDKNYCYNICLSNTRYCLKSEVRTLCCYNLKENVIEANKSKDDNFTHSV